MSGWKPTNSTRSVTPSDPASSTSVARSGPSPAITNETPGRSTAARIRTSRRFCGRSWVIAATTGRPSDGRADRATSNRATSMPLGTTWIRPRSTPRSAWIRSATPSDTATYPAIRRLSSRCHRRTRRDGGSHRWIVTTMVGTPARTAASRPVIPAPGQPRWACMTAGRIGPESAGQVEDRTQRPPTPDRPDGQRRDPEVAQPVGQALQSGPGFVEHDRSPAAIAQARSLGQEYLLRSTERAARAVQDDRAGRPTHASAARSPIDSRAPSATTTGPSTATPTWPSAIDRYVGSRRSMIEGQL